MNNAWISSSFRAALTGMRVRMHGQATMDWEAQDDAFVAKLLVPEGAKDIAVGSPVAVFVEDKVRACRLCPNTMTWRLLASMLASK